MAIIEALRWRYATKRMNGHSVPQELVDQIVEAAYLAPTSSGLQPFRVISISNETLKAQLQPLAFNQAQIVEGSHVLVFAAWDNYTEERIKGIMRYMAEQRGQDPYSTSAYAQQLVDMYVSRTPEENFAHTARQAYIGLGTAVTQAAALKVDATPMEGFDNDAVDQLLELGQKGLKSVAILVLGYRDVENDWLVNLKKVRTPKEEFLIELN